MPVVATTHAPRTEPTLIVFVPNNSALEPPCVLKDMYMLEPLLEVFSVRVDKLKDRHETLEIYGSVTVNDAYGPVTLWTRTKENPLTIMGSGEDILLEGPSRYMTSSDPLHIDLDLHCLPDSAAANDDAGAEEESPSGSIAKECIIFNPFVNNWDPDIKYDKVTRRFEGALGSVTTLEYMVMPRGLHAEIEVILPDVHGRDDSDDVRRLCGSITTDNGHEESELFRKVESMGQYVTVHTNSPSIPLSRAVVSTPFGGILRIKALLQEYDNHGQLATYPIAKGVVEFGEAYHEKVETKAIEGYAGGITVKVLWKEY